MIQNNNSSSGDMNKNVFSFGTLFRHDFHLVNSSQLPIVLSFSSLLLVTSMVFYWNVAEFNFMNTWTTHLSIMLFFFTIIAWLLMVVYESGNGHHTAVVRRGLRYGIILFIVSEIMFFFALFWSFFHFSLSPSIELGCMWPPVGTPTINPWGLPLTNTILLLSSGVTITLAHHSIRKSVNQAELIKFWTHLASTIVLGLVFLFCQWVEYTYGLRFRWTDNVYGSIFFVATGFHGFHVLLGTLGLFFCWIRSILTSDIKMLNMVPKLIKSLMFACPLSAADKTEVENFVTSKLYRFNFSSTRHIGFEAALWYWHFVDVVWIFLFCTMYWWGSAF